VNRFKKIEFQDIELDFEFIGIEPLGECYRFKQKAYEIYFDDFDVHVDLELYHYPEANYKKRNSFNINNIEVHTDSLKLKLLPEEHETIYKKIEDSIKILSINY
jgi:hypothetical protein